MTPNPSRNIKQIHRHLEVKVDRYYVSEIVLHEMYHEIHTTKEEIFQALISSHLG